MDTGKQLDRSHDISTKVSLVFSDTLRERGNTYVKHTAEGMPPVLHSDFDMVLDGRTFIRR